MRVRIQSEFVSDFFKWDPTNPVRGTEEFYQQTAKHLAGFDHDVVVEKDDPTNMEVENVRYVSRRIESDDDIRIICNPNDNRALMCASVKEAKGLLIWSNLYATTSTELRRRLGTSSDTIVCGISRLHMKQLEGENLRLVPHGVQKSEFENDGSLRQTYETRTGRRLAIFCSSPDRGLGVALDLRDELQKHGVDLLLSKYPLPIPNWTPLSNVEMATYFKTAHYWLHPGIGNELYCLAAAKAQVGGCCPIVRATNALDETVQSGFKLDASASIEDYKEFVIESVRSEIPPITSRHILEWKEATHILEEVMKEAVNRTKFQCSGTAG